VEHGLINDIAVCILMAWTMAVLARAIRQPPILAYLAAGIVIGPVGLKWVTDAHSIETVSGIGLILLLFMIGLEIDLKKILSSGKLIIATSLVQMLGGCALGFLLFKTLGFAAGGSGLDALYIAIACALSSTVVIVKLLYEKRELDTLPGRLTLGVLVLQDLFAILFLAVQPNLQNADWLALAKSLGSTALLVVFAFAASKYALPPIFRHIARSPELVLVGSLAWCFLVAGLAGVLHVSREMGALVAGVAISTYPYSLDVAAKVTSLRDFFLTLFFVGLGMTIPAPTTSALSWALVVSAFLITSRVLTVFPPLYAMKQGLRASLLPALNLSQMSEFSLVIVALGLTVNHLSPQTSAILAYTFVILAVLSTYLIGHSELWVSRLIPALKRFGFKDLDQATEFDRGAHRKIYVLGFYWTASSLFEELRRHSPEVLNEIVVIDFNPNVNRELTARGIPVLYGDISQRDSLHHAGIHHAEVILCSMPNSILKGTNNLRLTRELRALNPNAQLIMHAEVFSDVPQLYAAGADYVLLPRLIEAETLQSVLVAARAGRLAEKRAEVDAELADRNEVIA